MRERRASGQPDCSFGPVSPLFLERRRGFFVRPFLVFLASCAVAGWAAAAAESAPAPFQEEAGPESRTETPEIASLLAAAQLAVEETGNEEGAASTGEPATEEGTSDDEASGAGQGGMGTSPFVDMNVRFRGRVLDEAGDLGDPSIGSFSLWSKTKIGDRIVTNVTYDLGKTRMHDLWLQYDIGGGFQVRAGRSSLAWFGEFTESSHSRQTIQAAVGTKLTRSRESGIFMFYDRGAYNARLHVVQGSGYQAEDNSHKDVLGSVGRTFDIAGAAVLLDVGHYEGRDGPDDALIPRRQTGFYLEGAVDRNRNFRGAAFRREQYGREHFGGFARIRQRLLQGIWVHGEFGTETNHGPVEAPGHSSYLVAGTRYELPWNMTHLSADYRFRFGAVQDHELLLLFQWLFDFQNPRRH